MKKSKSIGLVVALCALMTINTSNAQDKGQSNDARRKAITESQTAITQPMSEMGPVDSKVDPKEAERELFEAVREGYQHLRNPISPENGLSQIDVVLIFAGWFSSAVSLTLQAIFMALIYTSWKDDKSSWIYRLIRIRNTKGLWWMLLVACLALCIAQGITQYFGWEAARLGIAVSSILAALTTIFFSYFAQYA